MTHIHSGGHMRLGRFLLVVAHMTLTGCLMPRAEDCADRGEVYVTAEQLACTTDADCTYVDVGCCGCNSGGEAVAVSKAHADSIPRRGCCGEDRACPAVVLCPAAVRCIEGQCVAHDYNEACSAVHRGDDGNVQVHSCDGSADTFWRCECDHDGGPHEQGGSAVCKAELQAQCGATVADLDSCHEPDRGTCVPGPGGVWQCTCAGDDTLHNVNETSCMAALWSGCESSCTRGDTTCSPGQHAGTYDCFCDYYGRSRVLGAGSCDEALDRCEPGGPCATSAGFCDESNDGGFHYACFCNDGTSGRRTPEDLGGDDDCPRALAEVCGSPP